MADYTSPALMEGTPSYDPFFAEKVRKAKAEREAREAAERAARPPSPPLTPLHPSQIPANQRQVAGQAQTAAITGKPYVDYGPKLPDENIERPEEPASTAQNAPGYGSIRAVRGPDGKITFTNRADLGGEEVDARAATRDIREANVGTRVYSPYERYSPTTGLGTQFGGATTGAEEGGYVFGGGELTPEGETDWSKVANPQAFEAFTEEPMENILARRAAEKAKMEALAKDPFAVERLESEGKIRAAGEPYRIQREATLADQAMLAQMEDEIVRELERDPRFKAIKDPAKRQAIIDSEMDERMRAFRSARARLTQREEVFPGGYGSSGEVMQ